MTTTRTYTEAFINFAGQGGCVYQAKSGGEDILISYHSNLKKLKGEISINLKDFGFSYDDLVKFAEFIRKMDDLVSDDYEKKLVGGDLIANRATPIIDLSELEKE